MYFLRKKVANATAASLEWLLPIMWLKVMRYESIKVGNCTFYGPLDFLHICEDAMHELTERDSSIAISLKMDRHMFWYDKSRFIRFEKHFSINDSFRAWGCLGIVAVLVYAHYKTLNFHGKLFPLFDHTKVRGINQAVRERTKTWLVINAFPQELIDCFESK